MSTHKHIDKICCVVLAVILIITVLLMNAKSLGIKTVKAAIGYESRLFNTSSVHNIDIVMNDWDSFIENCTNEEYASCNVIIDGEAYKNVAIRAKGNTSLTQVKSYGNNRYSFKIEFDHYDSTKTYHGLDKLCLNNIIQDNTYMKDYLTYQLMGQFGVSSPLCSYANITVNGETWGLYLAIESVEESFLQRNYGDNYGELYKPDSMNMGGGRGNGRDFKMDEWEGFEDQNNDSNTDTESDSTAPNDDSSNENSTSESPATTTNQNDSNQQMPNGIESPNMSGEQMQGGMNPPDMNSGQMPEGMTPPDMNNGQMSEGIAPPDMNNGQMSEGMTPPDNNENSSNSSESNQEVQNSTTSTQADSETSEATDTPNNQETASSDRQTRNNAPDMGSRGSSDVSLIYSDDEYDSYSNIFDNAKTDISDSDKDRLVKAIKNINENTNIEDSVDIEQVIRYFVVHNFVLNFDSYTGSMIHNYYLYEKDGSLSMIPWDYNLAFGGFQSGTDATGLINYPIDSPVSGGTIDSRPMLAWIFSNEEYTELYHTYFAEFITNFFDSGDFSEMIDSVKEMISPYVKDDPTKFCTYEEFETGIDTLKEFCLLRSESVSRQLDGTISSTSEGQQNNKENLIDSIDITISDMGSMGNSMGQRGNPGNMSDMNGQGNATSEQSNNNSLSPTQETNTNSENKSMDNNTFNEMRRPDASSNKPPDEAENAQNANIQISKDAWIWIGISTSVLLLGIIIAFIFKRRKR